MSYRCHDCGHIFEEGEQKISTEHIGYMGSQPVYQDTSNCPLCGGDYSETKQCEICGSEHFEEELTGGVCEECFEKYKYDIDMCYKLSEDDKSSVKINNFLYTMFDEDEIEQILFEALKECKKKVQVDCSDFINNDKEWFGEVLAYEVNKNEIK